MGYKANKIFTASTPEKGIVVWDTTLLPMCKKLKRYNPGAHGYDTLRIKLKEYHKYEFTTASGVHFIIQKLER